MLARPAFGVSQLAAASLAARPLTSSTGPPPSQWVAGATTHLKHGRAALLVAPCISPRTQHVCLEASLGWHCSCLMPVGLPKSQRTGFVPGMRFLPS